MESGFWVDKQFAALEILAISNKFVKTLANVGKQWFSTPSLSNYTSLSKFSRSGSPILKLLLTKATKTASTSEKSLLKASAAFYHASSHVWCTFFTSRSWFSQKSHCSSRQVDIKLSATFFCSRSSGNFFLTALGKMWWRKVTFGNLWVSWVCQRHTNNSLGGCSKDLMFYLQASGKLEHERQRDHNEWRNLISCEASRRERTSIVANFHGRFAAITKLLQRHNWNGVSLYITSSRRTMGL